MATPDGNKALKDCKHCMTRISRKAKVCPQCRIPVTLSSAIGSFLRTGIWMIAAIVSLGFAAYEKAEKYGYSEQLAQVVNDLDLARMTATVLRSEITSPGAPPPALLKSGEFAVSDSFGDSRMSMSTPPLSSRTDGFENSDRELVDPPLQESRVLPPAAEYVDPVDELIRIDQKIQEELVKKPRNEALLSQLIRRQQFLKTAR